MVGHARSDGHKKKRLCGKHQFHPHDVELGLTQTLLYMLCERVYHIYPKKKLVQRKTVHDDGRGGCCGK